MIFFKTIINSIKKLFSKKEEIKQLDVPKEIIDTKNKEKNKAEFIKSIKVNIKRKRKKVETLICSGDGLGIQKNISA